MLTSEPIAKEDISRLAEKSHAVLVFGQPGSNTAEVADSLSRAWLCAQGGCGECNVCRSIEAGRCVDLMSYKPYGSGNMIRIGAIKRSGGFDPSDPAPNLFEFLRTPPMIARAKVARFDQIDRATHTAFNAMLKILEEPPAYAKFILVTNEFSKIPPTIRSRCIPIPCSSLHDETLEPIFQVFGGTPGLNNLVEEHRAAYTKLWDILERSQKAPIGAAVGLSEQTRALSDEFSKIGNAGARGAHLEILRCIASWLLTRRPENPSLIQQSIDAHRVVAGNVNAGPVFDLLWARILA